MPLEHRTLSFHADLGPEDAILAEDLHEPTRCRVLVVDDDDLVRAHLCAMLSRADYDVDSARSGEEALRIFTLRSSQVVLTDWEMPEMNGLTLCRQLRSLQRACYVYILIHTVRSHTCDLLEGLAAGADDFVVKGASMPEILARLAVAKRITHQNHARRNAKVRTKLHHLFADQSIPATNRVVSLCASLGVAERIDACSKKSIKTSS